MNIARWRRAKILQAQELAGGRQHAVTDSILFGWLDSRRPDETTARRSPLTSGSCSDDGRLRRAINRQSPLTRPLVAAFKNTTPDASTDGSVNAAITACNAHYGSRSPHHFTTSNCSGLSGGQTASFNLFIKAKISASASALAGLRLSALRHAWRA